MTETLGSHDIGARFQVALRQLGGFLGKVGFALFLLAAGIAALVATTFIGILLALAAVFLTFAHSFGRKARRKDGDPDTLEARRTGDGWVIEG
ncbi:MAG TPA: hypothetical protein VFV70_09890 [Hyphomonadaceae bacterium]|nr:hypothetical protein [Hyphomonadaceae bacterium]